MISIYEISDSKKWNEIVKSFTNYDIYYLSEYVKAFQIHGDGEPLLFYSENSKTRAINVIMKRDIALDGNFEGKIPLNSYFDITTPYGYGGFLIEGEITKDSLKMLDEEYKEFCKSEGIVSEFVRFHPVLNNCEILEDIYNISKLGKTVTIELTSQEEVWDKLVAKNRNVIRKARKAGVEIFWGRSLELIEIFIEMYNATMDKDNATDYYYFKKDFYNSVLEDLKYNSMIFYAVYEKKIISMSIILFSNDQMHYHLSASDRNYQHLAPTNYLLFEAACWGERNGLKTLHLGGGLGSQEDSLYKFKKAFNKDSKTTFSIGRKIFDTEIYMKLVKMTEHKELNYNNAAFFPKYRISSVISKK